MNELEKDRTSSLWQEVGLHSYSEINENLKTDVCIVGVGLAGLSIAYQLSKRGYKVVLLEASRVASGQSGRTTAHLTYKIEEQLKEMLKSQNQEELKTFVHAHKRAIDVIEETIFQEDISCDFKRVDGYLFLGEEDDKELLDEEVRIGRELDLDLSVVGGIPAFGHLGPAVHYPDQAQFHPLKYMAGLLRVMSELEVSVFENSRVKDFVYGSDKHEVITENGFTVESRYLVVATDSPVNNRFYIHTKQAAFRTYVVGFELKNKMDIPLMWDTADPYHYIRVAGNTFILGGEDHRTGQNPIEDPYKNLIGWARQHFPLLGEVKWQWSGQVFEPVDGMAFIGRNPGVEKNIFIVTGQSGIGMTNSTIASMIIPDLIEGRENSMIQVFDPSRLALRDKAEFVKENSNTAFQYKDWLTPSEVKNLDEIPLDEGRLMRDGLVKNCVYHNEEDGFETRCAVCPHLGGIVHWNDLEKSWDCPCHGSRFNVHGQVIEGPSLSNLLER